MSNFKENIDMYITENIQESIRNLRRVDKEYDYLRKEQVEDSVKREKILDTLNEEDREFLEKFISQIYLMESKTHDWLYLQGYKDCVKLLNLIGAI